MGYMNSARCEITGTRDNIIATTWAGGMVTHVAGPFVGILDYRFRNSAVFEEFMEHDAELQIFAANMTSAVKAGRPIPDSEIELQHKLSKKSNDLHKKLYTRMEQILKKIRDDVATGKLNDILDMLSLEHPTIIDTESTPALNAPEVPAEEQTAEV